MLKGMSGTAWRNVWELSTREALQQSCFPHTILTQQQCPRRRITVFIRKIEPLL